jgi:hypothetical protein
MMEQLNALKVTTPYLKPKAHFPQYPIERLEMMSRKALQTSIEYKRAAKTLERVSKAYPVGSKEQKSIILSAKALAFVQYGNSTTNWESFLKTFNKPLSRRQILHLKSLGLSPQQKNGKP